MTSAKKPKYTTPGLTTEQAATVIEALQARLHTCNDLHLTLKHAHWNVVGPNFIAVHEMIDPQVESVRGFADDLAERIATLGGSPVGTPGAIVAERSWDEYSVGRAGAIEHLAALDVVYQGVISSFRQNIEDFEDVDHVSQDMLIAQTAELELFHWFVRAHLEGTDGSLATQGATSEQEAVRSVS